MATLLDTRFDPYPSDGGWAIDYPIPRRASTRADLYSTWQGDVTRLQSQMQRRLSKAELQQHQQS